MTDPILHQTQPQGQSLGFDASYVISLDRDAARLATFYAECDREGLQRPPRFAGIDAADLGLSGREGCRRSHVAALRGAIEAGAQSVLVFEDDCLLAPGFVDRVKAFMAAVPDDWDALWFGRQVLKVAGKQTRIHIAPGIERIWPHRTHCFALRGEVMQAALERWEATVDQHVDHSIGEMMGTQYKTYSPSDPLAGQSNAVSRVAVGMRRGGWWGRVPSVAPVKPAPPVASEPVRLPRWRQIMIAQEQAKQVRERAPSIIVKPVPPVGRLLGVVTLWNGDTALLPHFLKHYLAMGLDGMSVLVNRCVEDAEGVVERYRDDWVTTRLFDDPTWHEPTKDRLQGEMLNAAGMRPEDWVLHLDLDEFHEFPGMTAREAAERAVRKGRTSVDGTFLDRIAADGSFAPILPDVDLGEQFPIGLNLTGALMGGSTCKVMMASARARVTQGHHRLVGRPWSHQPTGIVHHFKWKAGVVERLRERWAQIERDCPVAAREAERLFAHLAENGGRVNLAGKALGARVMGRITPAPSGCDPRHP